jgi:hypothetical protein
MGHPLSRGQDGVLLPPCSALTSLLQTKGIAMVTGKASRYTPATPASTLHFAYSSRACWKSNLAASDLPDDSFTKANPRRVLARSSSASSPCCL